MAAKLVLVRTETPPKDAFDLLLTCLFRAAGEGVALEELRRRLNRVLDELEAGG
jgi:hypothetical protein